MPGLHISLGVFNRLFDLLETACQELDLDLATKNQRAGGSSFQQYAELLKELSELKEETKLQADKTKIQSQLLSYLLVIIPAPEQSPTIVLLRQEIGKMQKNITDLVNLTISAH